jgi:hypothetical protein
MLITLFEGAMEIKRKSDISAFLGLSLLTLSEIFGEFLP